MIPASERAKTVRALNRAATVTGYDRIYRFKLRVILYNSFISPEFLEVVFIDPNIRLFFNANF
jgi:hypothetical protein